MNSGSAIKPKFRTKKGDLTAYAFACGYQQEFTINYGDNYRYRLILYFDNPFYHIKLFVGDSVDLAGCHWNKFYSPNSYKLWVTFDWIEKKDKPTLRQLRTAFKAFIKALKINDAYKRELAIRKVARVYIDFD